MTTPNVHYRREGDPAEAYRRKVYAAQLTAYRLWRALRAEIDDEDAARTWHSVEHAERITAALHDVAVLMGIEKGERA